MHRNQSKLAAVALVAAIGLGVPALAKSMHSVKGRAAASLDTRGVKAQRERALDGYGSLRHAPTFGAPNPNHPAFSIGDSTSYNANLYFTEVTKRRGKRDEQPRLLVQLARPHLQQETRPSFRPALLSSSRDCRVAIFAVYDRSGFGNGTVLTFRS